MKYMFYKWTAWIKTLSRHLFMGKRVRLFVPLRCDGEGKVYVSERTKLGWPQAPRYGNGCILLQARTKEAVIRIGNHCAISNNVSVIAMESVEIGEDCLIGELVSIMDSDFHGIAPEQRRSGPIQTRPITIEKNVWLGSRVIVQKGVTIGENSIVTPNAVVTANIPPNVIAGGIPARVIRALTEGDHV